MAPRKGGSKNILVARLATSTDIPCSFCNRQVNDELLYGKLYAIGNIQCHYYCVLLSSCLIQKGKDEHGLFGFLYEDIIAEVERSKKHKCSYCNQIGANMGCSITQCRKQFHLPCGKAKNSVSLFYGNYKTFCEKHAPKQNIPDTIMMKAKIRKTKANRAKKLNCNVSDLVPVDDPVDIEPDTVCVICYEQVNGFPTVNTFWPPCCARDAWFHRSCLQRMALSAGMHYLKCPLCNDKSNFYEAVVSQGYYVPDRDAAWELEQNAFAEIYERPIQCSALECICPMGRSHDADTGAWSINICMLCGSSGQHGACGQDTQVGHVCVICQPAAPEDLAALASTIQAVISEEESRARNNSRRPHGPVMPSRMSLRRTKRNTSLHTASCSTSQSTTQPEVQRSLTVSSRETLNLKSPKKLQNTPEKPNYSSIKLQYSPEKRNYSPVKLYSPNKYDSPTKLLEEELKKKFGSSDVVKKNDLVENLRRKFNKPQPLCVKRRIINDILNGIFDNLLVECKQKEPAKQWCSPNKETEDNDVIEIEEIKPKVIDLTFEDDKIDFETENIIKSPLKHKLVDLEAKSLEISAKNETVNIDVYKINKNEDDYTFISKNNEIDIQSFKDRYLKEVNTDKKHKKTNRKRKNDEKIVIELSKKRQKMKRREMSNIHVKIKWRNDRLNLKLNNKLKKKKKELKMKKYKQYVLNCSSDRSCEIGDEGNTVVNSVVKPIIDVTPMKRKYVKLEKSPDNLVQTSIQNFFKIKTTSKEYPSAH